MILSSFLIIIFAVFCSANQINLSVDSSDASSVYLHFSVDNHTGAGDFVLGIAAGERKSVTANAFLNRKNNNSSALSVNRIAQGWKGAHYIHWFRIDLPEVFPVNSTATGAVNISISSAKISNPDEIVLRNGILYLPSTPGLLKQAPAEIPYIPFNQGVRLSVEEDGIYEFSVDDLIQLGVPVSTIPARNFRLFNQGLEIPLHTTAGNSEHFRPSDKILFYGEHLRGKNSHFTQYSNENVYWLTWGGVPGKRFLEVSGARRRDLTQYGTRFDTSATIARGFHDTLHFEYDNDIRWLGSIHEPLEMGTAPSRDTMIDNWYWGFIGANDLTNYTINLPSPGGRGTAQLLISLTGLTSIPHEPQDHSFSILINGKVPGTNNQAIWNGQNSFLFVSDTFAVNILREGENTISFLKEQRGFVDRAALNWIRVIYPRTYNALDDVLYFKNDESSFHTVVQYDLSNFSDNSIDLWDIRKNRIFMDMETFEEIRNNRKTYSLSFQDSANTLTRYVAQTKSKRLKPGMELDSIANFWNSLAGVDYIVISVDSFKTNLEPLLETHRSRGLRAEFIDINDIYNRFSHGIRDPESIRDFIKYLFSISPNHPPRYLLLGGDTTHDLDKKNRERNLVPTNLSRTPGWGPSSSDGYFVTVRGNNQFPDMYVGRFPAENKQHMKTMVEKTVNYINNPTRGFWRDNILLAGGGRVDEPEFRIFNDEVSSEVISSRMNILRMDADPASPYYKSEFNSTTTMAGYINAGLQILNFNGHGGGNVWSDSRFFSYNDLHRLHNGRWSTGGKLPVVFSFTCLTGFFESSFYRSLGEEFIRSGPNGAVAFYGASSYTTLSGNLIMNRLLLEQGLSGTYETLGELLGHVETLMLVKHGMQHIPLIRQYNLLGDPALPWLNIPDTLSLSVNKNILSGNDTLIVKGNTGPVKEGKVLIQILSGTEEWERRIVNVVDSEFQEHFSLKREAVTSEGVIRAYAWNNSAEIKGQTAFSKDIFMIYDLQIDPPRPGPGDSVRVSCRADVPPETPDALLYCLYATAAPHQQNTPQQGVLMEKDSSGLYTTVSKIPVGYSNDPSSVLQLRFRIIAGENSKESTRFTFPLLGRPDLHFTRDSISLYWTGDSMAISFEVLNAGNLAAPPYDIKINWIDSSNHTTTFKQLNSEATLLPGSTQQFQINLPDTSGDFTMEILLNDDQSFMESRLDNNRAVKNFTITSDTLRNPVDTVESQGEGLAISPHEELSRQYRVFLFSELQSVAQPLRTTSKWLSKGKDSVTSFHLGTRPELSSTDTLIWTFRPQDSAVLSTQPQNSTPAVMKLDPYSNTWRHGGNFTSTDTHIEYRSINTGPYALAMLNDNTPPQVRLTVAGRELKFLDYVAKDRPFNIIITDPSGINTSSFELFLNSKKLPKESYSEIPLQESPEHLNITIYPTPQKPIDSLMVSVDDLAGNNSEVVFAYMPGEDLKINFFSCHPNPFTARMSPDGSTVQPIRFAFLITDLSDIELTLYTKSGRNIKSWRFNDLIGYQEIEWDGRDRHGYRIANGTYFAKLTASNTRTTTRKIIRIAKLEGYR
ncbi:peptidase C25 [Chitinispirillum alkaliphilum]|nr:peptidase C25 [Chitinispirillum alkaliphilum]